MEVEKKKKLESNKIFCEVCSAPMPNETTLLAHLKGQKHARNLARVKEWNDAAKRSVYVGGIKSVVAAELAIPDYFNQFGSTVKVTIDKTMRQYAIVELDSEEVVKKLLESEEHVINGVPVIIKPRELKEAKSACPKKHKDAHKVDAIPDEIWKNLAACSDVDSQMQLLQTELRLTENDKHMRDLICQLILSALSEAFPESSLTPYGSSANGFGTHDCDLDLHFAYERIHPDILHEILSHRGEGSDTEDPGEPSPHEVAPAVGEVIKRCVPDCHKVKVIAQTRFPLVRFQHKGSAVRCDLSLANRLAVINTTYLRACRRLCPAFGPLAFAVRCWMRHWELAGGLHVNGPRLNNYAVTLLVLFFLQNTNKLSTLEEMTASVSPERRTTVDGWDCTLPKESSLLAAKEGSLVDWLAAFFQFYAKVEFSGVALDLRTAKYEELSANSPAIVSPPEARTFKHGPLNVRDPFERSHNVTGNVTARHMLIFTKRVNNAALAVKMKRFRQKAPSCSTWGLLNLFVDHHQKRTQSDDVMPPTGVDFTAHMVSVTLKEATVKPQHAAGILLLIFRDVFRMECKVIHEKESVHLAEAILPNGGSLQPNVADSPPREPTGQKRPASPDDCRVCKRARVVLDSPTAACLQSESIPSLELPCELRCVATHKLWEGRRKARRKLVQKGRGNLLDLERKVSQLLLTDSERQTPEMKLLDVSASSTDSSAEPLFNFAVDLSLTNDNSVSLGFRFLAGDGGHADYVNFLHHVDVFLSNFLNKCIKGK